MIPRRLAKAIKLFGGNQRKMAEYLGINPAYVNRWMKHGIEPKNPIARSAMGFQPLRKRHDGRSGFAELPEHIKWWRKLDKGSRDQYIRNTYDYIENIK